MKAKVIVLLMVLMAGARLSAQQKIFTAAVGYQRTVFLDKQASPLVYKTNEKTLSLGYNRIGPNGIFNLELDGALGDLFPNGLRNRQLYDPGYNPNGTPKKDSFPLGATIYNGRFRIGYLQETASGFSTVGKGKVYTNDYWGGSFSNQLFYSDNMVRTGWMNSASANAEYLHTARINTKHFFLLKVSIPLFAINTRLPYSNSISSPNGESNIKTFFRRGSRFAWLADFQNIRVDAGYEYSISKKVSLGLRYFGQWLHYTKEKPVTLIQNNISISASVK